MLLLLPPRWPSKWCLLTTRFADAVCGGIWCCNGCAWGCGCCCCWPGWWDSMWGWGCGIPCGWWGWCGTGGIAGWPPPPSIFMSYIKSDLCQTALFLLNSVFKLSYFILHQTIEFSKPYHYVFRSSSYIRMINFARNVLLQCKKCDIKQDYWDENS